MTSDESGGLKRNEFLSISSTRITHSASACSVSTIFSYNVSFRVFWLVDQHKIRADFDALDALVW